MALHSPVVQVSHPIVIAENVALPAYAQGDTSVPLIRTTIGDVFDQACQKHPDRLAAVFCEENISWTFRQLNAEVTRVAANLYDLGVRSGDRVGLFMCNYSPGFLLLLAAARLGAVAAMLHPTFLAHELEYALQLTDCNVLVVQPSYKTTDCIQLLLQIMPELETSDSCQCRIAKFPFLTAVFVAECRGVGTFGNHRLCPTNWRSISGLTCFHTFVALPYSQATVAAISHLDVKPTDPICISFTSGSTGKPKAVVSSHRNQLNASYLTGRFIKTTGHMVICVPVPMYHIYGTVSSAFVVVTHGATVVFPGSLYTSKATLKTIHTHQCNVVVGVGPMYVDQMLHPAFGQTSLASLQCAVVSGSNCLPLVKTEIIRRFQLRQLLNIFGMTGDIAELDAQGYCRIIDRKKDMIIKGGENIFPGEVEQCLTEHPNIQNVAVIGVTHEWMEEEVSKA
ncbi:hypothetical protein H4R34_000918 [Dimargaris verticillata]|uniref:AMP-dependent synthetase/ligase domain-containing protein n=1 Tax=Dimargaris verticillata TaxID=2761393 RepID=A0A9W8BAU5_9FUNG|nr:hypothetical protein H4R34_000918 [Dimargaris verticillata]